MNYINFFFIIILVTLLYYLLLNNTNLLINFNNKLINNKQNHKPNFYYQNSVGKLNNITKSVLKDLNIKHTPKLEQDWILYIPKNYNYVELELVAINPYNDNQLIYAIKGCDSLCSKNQLWFNLKTHYGRKKASSIIPETFNLNDIDDINIFKKQYPLNNINQKNNDVFILKKNIQGKKGLLLINNPEKALRTGQLNNFKVIQKYIPNPFTINKRKLNLRLYVVIICYLDKQEWLLFKDGKCIYTNKRYDKDNSLRGAYLQDKEYHFTSLNLDINKVYLDEALPESLKDFKKYLGDNKYQLLMDNILHILQQVKNVYKNKLGKLDLLKYNKCFQLFGLDFIMDEHLKPYLLEFNKGPAMSIKSPKDTKLKYKLILNMFQYILNYNTTNNNSNNNNNNNNNNFINV